MASFKKLSKSDVTVVPYYANKQWDLSYCPYPTSSEYLTIYKGTNVTNSFSPDTDPITENQYERLVYSQINQLFYQKYTSSLNTSSLANSIYYESASQQRPTSSYFIYNDSANLVENFPTGAMDGIRVLAINQDLYGDKVLPNHFRLSSSAYDIIDDGYGNLYDGVITGSQQSANTQYTIDGVKLYSSGYNIDGTGTALEWNTVNAGGSYAGTFWTNPNTNTTDGRLNYTGLWSGKSLTYFGSGFITCSINVPSNTTYYVGIGCDNYASLYLDDNLVVSQIIPDADGFGGNYNYWHIYPINMSAGNHVIKLLGVNAGIPSPGNPGSMGIEVYNNTETQISASITASPNGSSIPGGLNVVYSSKDHLTEGNFSNPYDNHIGNLFYAHGLGIITNQDYQMMFPLPPIARNDYGSFLTTDTPKTISASLNDYARSGTLNTGSLVLSGSTSGPEYSWATGSNGTIVLTTTVAGTYSVYYTTGADIVGSCAINLRSNKAKVTAVVTPEVVVPFTASAPSGLFGALCFGSVSNYYVADAWYYINNELYTYGETTYTSSLEGTSITIRSVVADDYHIYNPGDPYYYCSPPKQYRPFISASINGVTTIITGSIMIQGPTTGSATNSPATASYTFTLSAGNTYNFISYVEDVTP